MGRFLQCCEWYFDIQNSNPKLDSQAPKAEFSQKSIFGRLFFDPKVDSYTKMERFLQSCKWNFDIHNLNLRLDSFHKRQKPRSFEKVY